MSSPGGLQHAAARRKELARKLANEDKRWRDFKREWPKEAQFLEGVREASEEFQKEIAYALPDQMDDLFSFASKMDTKKRDRLLEALNVVFPSKRGANPYLALMRAGSISGYDKLRVLSKNAFRIEAGIEKGIAAADFGNWRKIA